MTCCLSLISFYLWHNSLLKIAHTNFTMVKLWSCLLASSQLRILSTTLSTQQLRNLNRILYCLSLISFWLLQKLWLNIIHTNFTMGQFPTAVTSSVHLQCWPTNMTLIEQALLYSLALLLGIHYKFSLVHVRFKFCHTKSCNFGAHFQGLLPTFFRSDSLLPLYKLY